MTWGSMVCVGRVVRPHGLRGHVVVEPETDFGEERFAVGAQVWRQVDGAPRALTIREGRPQGGRWVIRVEGFASIEDAETLRNVELRIPEDAGHLGPGEYYLHDLVGCQVTTVAGEALGPVRAVYRSTGGALLAIDRQGEEVLVPLVAALCPEVDVTAKRIVVDPPAGLLEVNQPGRKGESR